MKDRDIVKVEWTGIELDDMVWRYPSDKIGWGSELCVMENQAAAIFTKHAILSRKLKMHDYFGDVGNYAVSIDKLPLLHKACPDVARKRFLKGSIVFCSTKEHSLLRRVYGGESSGQAVASCGADASCRFKIVNPKLFLETLVANGKITSDSSLLKYFSKTLGIELFRRNRPYGWTSTQTIGIEDWPSSGIQLLSLQFEHYKESFAAAGV